MSTSSMVLTHTPNDYIHPNRQLY